MASFKGDSRFKGNQGCSHCKIIVSLNNATGNPALRDLRVRQVLSYAIDRKAFVDGVEAGYAASIGSHAVPNPSEPYYADMTKLYSAERFAPLLWEARLAFMPGG